MLLPAAPKSAARTWKCQAAWQLILKTLEWLEPRPSKETSWSIYIYIQLYTYYLTPSLVEHWSYHYSHVYIALCAFSGLSGLQWPSVAFSGLEAYCFVLQLRFWRSPTDPPTPGVLSVAHALRGAPCRSTAMSKLGKQGHQKREEST